ncbi:MAG: FkbM family methyltransferase [Candidatus Paceibacterota bacterium]
MKLIQDTKKLIKSMARKFLGLDLSLRKIIMTSDFIEQKKLLRDTNTKIIFDVGANVGQTTQKYRKLFPKSKIFGFEPFKDVFKIYSNNTDGDKMTLRNNIALSNHTGTASFYSNECHYTNSLLPFDDKYSGKENLKSKSQIQIITNTLDNFCDKNNLNHINILKIDVQGGEMLVLEGAKEMLSKKAIDLIYSEVEFVAIYKNQPLFKDIEKFLAQYDYHFYKNFNLYYDKDNVLISGDAIFIRTELIK